MTKASGKARRVSARWACNRFLRQALVRWAFCSLPRSSWARGFSDGQPYDEEVHRRNRSKPPLPHAA